jgi:flagellin-like protein
MKEESTGVSPVIATILLIAITVVAVGIVMAFVAGLGTPKARPIWSPSVYDKAGTENELTLKHGGGDDIVWSDVEMSVTENVDSSPKFVSPSVVLKEAVSGSFKTGEYMTIDRTSDDFPLKNETSYHIMMRHLPSNQIILDTNAKPTTA